MELCRSFCLDRNRPVRSIRSIGPPAGARFFQTILSKRCPVLWFTETGDFQIGRLIPSTGAVAEASVPNGEGPFFIVNRKSAGPGGLGVLADPNAAFLFNGFPAGSSDFNLFEIIVGGSTCRITCPPNITVTVPSGFSSLRSTYSTANKCLHLWPPS